MAGLTGTFKVILQAHNIMIFVQEANLTWLQCSESLQFNPSPGKPSQRLISASIQHDLGPDMVVVEIVHGNCAPSSMVRWRP